MRAGRAARLPAQIAGCQHTAEPGAVLANAGRYAGEITLVRYSQRSRGLGTGHRRSREGSIRGASAGPGDALALRRSAALGNANDGLPNLGRAEVVVLARRCSVRGEWSVVGLSGVLVGARRYTPDPACRPHRMMPRSGLEPTGNRRLTIKKPDANTSCAAASTTQQRHSALRLRDDTVRALASIRESILGISNGWLQRPYACQLLLPPPPTGT